MENNENINLNSYIDHTNLKQDIVSSDIDKLIDEAKKYGFHSICINPYWVKYAREKIDTLGYTNDLKICTVIGFHLGQNTAKVKAFEAKDAIQNGADELDFVVNTSIMLEQKCDEMEYELNLIRKITEGKEIKLIIESSLIPEEAIKNISKKASKIGFDFIKTATGLAKGGATVEHIKWIKESIDENTKIKASGGIKTKEQALELIKAGADRIGTSNGLSIIEGTEGKSSY